MGYHGFFLTASSPPVFTYLQKGSDQVSDELQVVFHRFQQGIGHNGKSCGKYASPQDPGHVHGAQTVK